MARRSKAGRRRRPSPRRLRWAWNGLSAGDLFERLRVSIPEGRPRALTRAQKVDVLAYMLRENAFPAGDTELPRRTARLNAIAFEALEP